MSRKPLCPPMPPPCLMRATPGAKSSSSCTTRISSALILKKPASICTARPLAFMKLCGRRSQAPALPPVLSRRATSAWYFGSFLKCTPCAEAKRSTSQKPALCRVRSYSLPGLPRPTTRRIKAGCSRRSFLLFLLGLVALGTGLVRTLLRCGPAGRRLAFLRRRRLLGGRHFGRRNNRCGFLFLDDERRDDDRRHDGVLGLVQRRLHALRQRELARVDRLADRQGREIDLDEFRQVVRE